MRATSMQGFLRNVAPLGVLLLAPATRATADARADPGGDGFERKGAGGDLGARRC